MKIRMLGWVAVAVLVAVPFLRPAPGDHTGLLFVASAGALLATVLAGLTNMYLVAAVFMSIAVLFNPVVPVTFLSLRFVWMYLGVLSIFGVWLAVLKLQLRPRLAILSITDRTPGSESL